MTVTDVRKDPAALTLTIASEWAAPIAGVWELWADPRKLERWWGPPTFPATVVDHDLRPGGRVTYFMTGPDGEQYHGWWRVIGVDEPNHLDLEDGFADADGVPDETLPTTRFSVDLTERAGGGTRMLIESRFPSLEAMEQLVEMGMEDGIQAALGQVDTILGTG
jgi:uncharacterized protein YndB with AHSA1/START domain